jgi:gamma-glutamyltranspeptidase/glutathione hydrolase
MRVLVLFSLVVLPTALRAQTVETRQRFEKGAVVTQSAIASEVGASILRRGGNAIDAAVASAFALAVTLPQAGNIGGGGFLVVLLPDGRSTTFDFRERAPLLSRPDMFLDENGEYDSDRHHYSHVAVGVPGSVAGLWLAHYRFGHLAWRDVVDPAVTLAAVGFRMPPGLARSLESKLERFRAYPATLAQFSKDGKPYQAGDLFAQADLALSLARIREKGLDGFYRGETADLLVAEMERGGGMIRHADLRQYRAIERQPIRGRYRGLDIISMPPPSSGGVALVEMLNILEGYELRELGERSTKGVHLMVESMRRAFADRARFLGDSDFVEMPLARLTSKQHADTLRSQISLSKASTSSPKSFQWPAESDETTHLSVVDSRRMAVSLTTTLEASYGSLIVVPGAGFLLNNEMGDFNPREGMTTAKGHIGTKPNLVKPGKRMLSSMTPTIVARDGKAVLIVGTPGGRTIINTVLQIIVGIVDHGLSPQAAVDAPRFHHQWLPDRIIAEGKALSKETREALESLGHTVETRRGLQGSAMAIGINADASLDVGCDRRRQDSGAAGY